MRKSVLVALLALAAPALADPGAVLDANRSATAGMAWDAKAALRVEYAYSGQGLTGTMASLEDLKSGAFVDSYDIGPNKGANGYDGRRAWEQEPSGTVTWQAGGDVVPLAISEAYVDRNLWWRRDRGGAAIDDRGRKTENGLSYDVVGVTPKGGKPLEAWFDAKTHLLARTIEAQSTLTITQIYSDYARVQGVLLPRKIVIDDGSHNLQTQTLTLARFLPAQPASAFAKPEENLHDYAIRDGAHEATVPFKLINNHIYAEVSINGAAPRLFLFDTGGHSILTPPTAKALGVKYAGSQTAAGAGAATVESGVARVDSIAIGAATISNQPVSVMDFDTPGVEGVACDGMVGYEFFARFVTRFDYGSRTITFIDRRYFDPKDAGTAVPMRLYHQFPEVDGTYGGVAGRFGIDTGSRWALLLTGPYVTQNHLRETAAKGVVAATGWGVGGTTRGYVLRGARLTLGDVVVPSPLTAMSTDTGGGFAAADFPNNVGGGVLKRFAVTLDYQHSVLYLKPLAGPVPDLDAFDRSGLWINEADGGFKIFEVTKGSPAEDAGLKAGDVIEAVDGRPVKDIALYDLRMRLRDDAPGTVVTFAIRRGATVEPVKITLRDLI
ncbi:MAG: aspartyl protease family protein [Alphaproteobacteria bacterium]|nr:aspartyl protease family protein [Alphaproteobacteria bacterium]